MAEIATSDSEGEHFQPQLSLLMINAVYASKKKIAPIKHAN